MFEFNRHSALRAAQRNLSAEEIQFVIQHGVRFHRSGAVIHFLRRCDLPSDCWGNGDLERLIGTAAVLSKDERTLITVWRNRRSGLKRIRLKPEFGPVPYTAWADL